MARAKPVLKQPVVKPFHPPNLHTVELVECPLCIEPLDATDRDFWPCPCGYQVCLFCYQRLQSEYNNTCPGCRQQYSDDLEGVRQHIARKQAQQQKADSSGARAAPGGGGSHHHAHHGHTATATRAGKLQGPAAKQRAGHADAGGHAPGRATHAAAEASSSLPPTASWAVASAGGPGATDTAMAQQQQQQQQALLQQAQQQVQVQHEPPPPTTGDESAWPTLGAAQQQPSRPEPGQGHERRRSSSSSLTAVPQQQQQQQRYEPSRSSFESTASTHTAHSERQQQQQLRQQQRGEGRCSISDEQQFSALSSEQPEMEQQQQQLERNSSGFTTVEVSTVVSGKRHDVCVHVSHAEEVQVLPEAAVLLDVLQQAVHSSKLSSTEAAVQLVQCLRKLEADSSSSNGSKQGNWLQQVLAAKGSNGLTPMAAGRPPLSARAPPPGFGPAAGKLGSAGATANGLSNGTQHHGHQQQHELPPAGWSSAHRAALQAQQQAAQAQAQGETPQGSSMHSVDSTNSLFSQGSSLSQSMWTDCGLPGVDLGLGAARLGTGLAAGVPARLQMLWAGGGGANSSSGAGNGLGFTGTSSSTVTGPPPGFGSAGVLGLGSRLNGTYNPLSFANAGAAAQGGGIGVPPGFGLSEGAKQQQQAQPAALYQPF